MKINNISFLIIASTAITACGGGGGGDSTPATAVTTNYETLLANTSGSSSVKVIGVQRGGIGRSDGTINHANGFITAASASGNPLAISTDVRIRQFSDLDNSASEEFLLIPSGILVGNYEYVQGYIHERTVGAVTTEEFGVIGIDTRISDVPSAGTASYSGSTFGVFTEAASGDTATLRGNSSVNVNFGASTATVQLNNFAVDPSSDLLAIPLDTVNVNMTLSGSELSGTISSITNGGANVGGDYASLLNQAEAGLFGFDAANQIPDEVGGAVLSGGADGGVQLIFLAD